MRVAKADNKDLINTSAFLNAAELALEGTSRWGVSPINTMLELDDEDVDKIQLLSIRKSIAKSENIDEEDIDDRIILYELLQRKFQQASCCWRRVYYAAEVLIETCTDPTKSYLDWAPGIEQLHVMPEQ